MYCPSIWEDLQYGTAFSTCHIITTVVDVFLPVIVPSWNEINMCFFDASKKDNSWTVKFVILFFKDSGRQMRIGTSRKRQMSKCHFRAWQYAVPQLLTTSESMVSTIQDRKERQWRASRLTIDRSIDKREGNLPVDLWKSKCNWSSTAMTSVVLFSSSASSPERQEEFR